MRSRMALCAVLACGAVLAVPAPAAADGNQQRMLHVLNVVRAHHGLASFHGSPSLHRSASAYARWMLRSEYFGHLNRIRASGGFSRIGEALAWHSDRRARVVGTVRRWMGSAPHRALIMNPGFRWIGSGMARGRLGGQRATTWVLHFGGR
jgi:uncharacterized protein YkwD